MRVSDLFSESETLKLPDIEVGDEVLVGKFKNRKATVKGFTKDEHNQPVLQTTKGDQKLFKPRLQKLMVSEGLIALPPRMMEEMEFYLAFYLLWWARDRFKGKMREFPEHYKAFKQLVAEWKVDLPPEPFKPKEGFTVHKIKVDLTGMPSTYARLKPSDETIRFAIDWRPIESNTHGTWMPKQKAIKVNPLSFDYLRRYPSASNHPDDLKAAISTLRETLSHETRHMVQFVIIQHPDQTATKKDYTEYKAGYRTSPVEFDPTIGSSVEEFLHLWSIANEGGSAPSLSKAVKQFTAAIPTRMFDTFDAPNFFKNLKSIAPERYKIAVRKFVVELQKRLL